MVDFKTLGSNASFLGASKQWVESRTAYNVIPFFSMTLVCLCNFCIDFLDRYDQVIAIVWLIFLTTGSKTITALVLAYIFDFLILNTRRFLDLPKQHEYAISCVDRVWAALALSWSLSEVFMYFPGIVITNSYLSEVHSQFTLGMEYFFGTHEWVLFFFSFVIFRQVVRRRGPDTKWYGAPKQVWIKHFVRYYWCAAMGMTVVLNLVMFVYTKFFVNSGIGPEEQEIFALTCIYGVALVSAYLLLGIIMGKRARLPLIHGACICHVGKLKEGMP
jgi:hypothetical protein